MEDKNAAGNYYTIGHLVQFTGLTDRTIRNYISSGILEGEKINGLWHFAPEEVDKFLRNPAVRPSIQAKRNSVVYDFLVSDSAGQDQTCMILDFPGADKEKLTEYFCASITQGSFRDLDFSFDGIQGRSRVILKGKTKDILSLVNGWYENQRAYTI